MSFQEGRPSWPSRMTAARWGGLPTQRSGPESPSPSAFDREKTMIRFPIALWALLSFFVCACGPGKDTPDRPAEASPEDRAAAKALVAEADVLIEAGRFPEAWERLRQAHARDAAHPRAKRLIAQAAPNRETAKAARATWQEGVNFMVANDPVPAFKRFRDAATQDPSFDRARLDYARATVTLRRFDEALELLDSILAERPNSSRALFAAAEASYRLGDDERCLKYLERLPEIEARHGEDPKVARELPEIRYLEGLVAHRAKKPVRALAALKRGLELSPDNIRLLHLYGGIKLEEGDFSEAAKDLKRVLELDKDHVDAKVNLARALDRAGEESEAIRWYQSALATRKRDWELMISLARSHEELGERRDLLQASSWLERAIEVNPQAHEAYFSLSKVHRRLGNRGLSRRYSETYERIKAIVTEQDARLRDIERRLDKNPNDIEARLEAIAIHEEFHHVEDVLETAQEILRIEPRHPDALHFCALSFRLQNKRDESLFEALKLVDAHPDDARGWALAAWNYRDAERWEACRRCAKKGFDLDPTNFSALEHYLAACQKLGSTQEIRRLWPLYQKLRQKEEKRLADIKRRDEERRDQLLKALGED